MSRRHNRKRTRSRPRHRDAGFARSAHTRTYSMDSDASLPLSDTSSSPFQHSYSLAANRSADHWHQMYSAWQARSQIQVEQEKEVQRARLEQEQAMEARRLQFYGGEPGDEMSLFEPMLRVVTDLFDGDIDYQDP